MNVHEKARLFGTPPPDSRGTTPAYAALAVEAAKLGLPRAFATDLTNHDKAAIAAKGPMTPPFLWCVHAAGTALVWADFPKRASANKNVYAVIKHGCSGDVSEARWFAWNGHALAPIALPTVGMVCEVYDAISDPTAGEPDFLFTGEPGEGRSAS